MWSEAKILSLPRFLRRAILLLLLWLGDEFLIRNSIIELFKATENVWVIEFRAPSRISISSSIVSRNVSFIQRWDIKNRNRAGSRSFAEYLAVVLNPRRDVRSPELRRWCGENAVVYGFWAEATAAGEFLGDSSRGRLVFHCQRAFRVCSCVSFRFVSFLFLFLLLFFSLCAFSAESRVRHAEEERRPRKCQS